ncbi:protein BatD [Pseudidiomarina sp. 1APR75-33.1]|uniref:BatD family protein n=1 Tax=Pseudidiomarina terrestris TaxID=2820060 RepID=UPI0026562CCF|nr:BatD family protein [Pseudidiomarina sp. 1APR75-33.1]MDN7127878.1 protein BatD [Pseudidiomarina sp. 1APR75-33.1]
MVVYRSKIFSVLTVMLLAALLSDQPGIAQPAAAPEVAISVDKNPIAANDTFILTLTVDQLVNDSEWRPQDALPNLQVLGSSSSRSTQIINGETSEQTTFNTIIRAPSDAGNYTIGPIELLGTRSNSIELEVLSAAQSDQLLDQRKAFMRVELARTELYVQEQVQLTAKLYLAANLHSGNIIPPKLEDADIRQVGRDNESTEIINGRKFQVFSRNFVVIPQRSGEQVIRGPLFQGQINVNSNRTLFPSFSSTESITTAAEDLAITVKPIPASWPPQSNWLPAEIVTLSLSVGSEGSKQDDTAQQQFTQGEPINLTYRLTAVGPLPDQLPRLDELVASLAIDGASIYPEAPESAVNQRNGRMVSQQTVRVAIIPHQGGELVIPALPILWFNTQLREQDRATAPAQRFSIVAASNASQLAAPAEPPATSAQTTKEPAPLPTSEVAGTERLKRWQILTVVFAALWLITLIWMLWLRRAKPSAVTTEANPEGAGQQQELRAIKHACMRDDAAAAELLLKRWVRARTGADNAQLTQLANTLDHAPLRSQLEHLQRCRFAPGQHEWHEGKALWRALQAALKAADKKDSSGKPVNDLPDLYPN